MSKDIDELVAAVPAAHGSQGCWAEKLSEDATEYMEKIREREAELGRPLHRGTILDNLREYFDTQIGIEALTKHIKRRCRCDS